MVPVIMDGRLGKGPSPTDLGISAAILFTVKPIGTKYIKAALHLLYRVQIK